MTRETYTNWVGIPNGCDDADVDHLREVLRDGLIAQAERDGFTRVVGGESHRSQQNRDFFPTDEQSPYDEILVVRVYVEAA